jgi:DNA polymerase III sliding clamp (beta) subunit (PCNA family)
MSQPTITITARQFAGLVDAVIPFASADDDLPVLNTVRIESRGKYLLAMTTDRFRIGVKRLAAPDDGGWPEFAATVPLRAVRSIKQVFRPGRGMDTDLTLAITEDDVLTVEPAGALVDMLSARASYSLERAEYPKFASLITKALAAESAAGEFGVNPKFLADFSKVTGPTVAVRPTAPEEEGKAAPIVISDGEDFLGLLMPRKLIGSTAEPRNDLSDWNALLEPPKPAAKKRTSKKAVA